MNLSERWFQLSPQELRQELQHDRSDDLRRRRAIILLALIGMLSMAVVTLFQTGILPHLPDPPGSAFNSEKVNSSSHAFRFGVPDGAIVLLSLAATLVLAAFGGANRASVQSWVPLLMTSKAALDAGFAALYLWNMIFRQKVACIYCILTALAVFTILALTLPESARALSQQSR